MLKPIDLLGFGPTRVETRGPDGSWTITVTPGSLVSRYPPKSVRLTDDQYRGYRTWLDDGVLIQNALPDLNPADRETLMTGL